MGIEENIATTSEAGLILSSVQSFPFLCFLSFWGTVLKEINDTHEYMQVSNLNIYQNEIKIAALKAFLAHNREELIENSIKYAKEVCEDIGIETERRVRKKKRMAEEKSNDVGLNFQAEMKRDLYTSIDSITQEIKDRFEQLHFLSQKYDFLIPTNLIDDEFEFEFEEEEDVNMAEVKIERKRLKNFLEFSKEKNWKEGPLELLRFIIKYGFQNSVPNLTILLRVFLTKAVSVASCERSFSKLKLIKNYLRSTMSNHRLTNLAILSIEREYTESLDVEEIIKDFAIRKVRRFKPLVVLCFSYFYLLLTFHPFFRLYYCFLCFKLNY